jgi:hypothetical protein
MPTFVEETRKPPARKDNPYRDAVKSIAGTKRTLSFTTESTDAKGTADEVKKARTLLTEAGNELETPVTVRVREETLDDKVHVKVYFWTIAKIRHTDKKAAPAKAAPAKAAPAKAPAK